MGADPLFSNGLNLAVWLILVVKVVIVFLIVLLSVLFMIMYERKVVARMGVRYGPNRAGPNGWLQSLADGTKLLFKESFTPRNADKAVCSEAACPSRQRSLITGRAPCSSIPARIASAWAPSTTRRHSMPELATASSTSSSIGRPPSTGCSCLTAPKRRPSPAASTTTATVSKSHLQVERCRLTLERPGLGQRTKQVKLVEAGRHRGQRSGW